MGIYEIQECLRAIEERFAALQARFMPPSEQQVNGSTRTSCPRLPIDSFEGALRHALRRLPPPVPALPPLSPFAGGLQPVGDNVNALIDFYAQRHGVDAKLVRAVVKAESSFNPRSVSSAGAMGLMQLMPDTARSLGVTDPFDPAQNLDGGVRYLKGLMERFGDLRLALAAYNAGPNAVRRSGGVPPFTETQNYVERVMRYLEEEK